VLPLPELNASQLQMPPGEPVTTRPLDGLVLVSEMLCAAGAGVPICQVPKEMVEGVAVNVGELVTVSVAVTVALVAPDAEKVMLHE
jgi:hypothetical protein